MERGGRREGSGRKAGVSYIQPHMKGVNLSCRIKEWLMAQVQEAAKRKGLSVSAYGAQLIEAQIKEELRKKNHKSTRTNTLRFRKNL